MKRLAIIMLLLATASGFTPTYLSFNTGQISPLMEARIDWAKYRSSARTVENMLVTTQGPVFRRPGTKYIATQGDSTAIGRVISYEHSVDDSYVLLLEDQTMRFYRDGGQILMDDGTETMVTGDQVAHWLLNDTTGLTVVDDTGNSHDGTATVDVGTLHADGHVGTGCFDIDGQYGVTVADSSAFTFSDNSDDTAFSLACWAFIEESTDTQLLISKAREGTAVTEWRLSILLDRTLQLVLSDSGTVVAGGVSEWDCRETGAAKTVADSIGANNGLLQVNDAADITVTGQLGTAFDLSATDAVIVPDAANLSFGDGSNDSPFSITSWVFVEMPDTAGLQAILSKWDVGGGGREWILYIDKSMRAVVEFVDEDVGSGVLARGSTRVGTGWNFVTCTYDGRGGAAAWQGVKIYINGFASIMTGAVGANPYVSMVNGTGEVALGALLDSGTPDYSWEGIMDNTVLWDVELTASDVATLYNNGVGWDVSTGTPTIAISSTSDGAVDFGWHFLVSTYLGDAGAGATEPTAADGIILYVDGEVAASTAFNNDAYAAMQNTAADVKIGSISNSADDGNLNYFSDRIDEVSVYSDVLTPADITTLHSTGAYSIPTPYLTADLFDLDFIKSEDVMYIVHPDYEPRQLSRLGHISWSLDALNIGTGPFQAENEDTDLTITPSGAAFTADSIVTLTAASGLFQPGHVASIWQIDQVRGTSQITGTFTANGNSISTPFFSGAYGFTTSGNSDGTITLMRSTNNGASWRPALTALTDTDFDNPAEIEEDGAIYRIVMSNFGSGSPTYTFTITDNTNRGVVRITGVQNSTVATATVVTALVDGTATSNWREGYWSPFRGWPETVTIHQQRLTFGGSTTFPQTVWFGKTDPDDYTNFTEGTLDTSAFTVALAGNNSIQWMLSQDYLLIGNSGSCGKYGDQGKAVTPTSPNYQEQTRQGAANLPAIVAGDAILYVERGSRTIREFVFDFQSDKYQSPDLSVLSPEITESGIKDVAYQFRPYPILWCVLNNGDIATLTFQKNQSVVAWTKQITDGDFESITVIPNTTEDEVWVTVKRTIDGVTETVVRYVEQFQPQDWGSDDNDAWFVDSGISYDGTDSNSFTGADHLDGETVSIYADLLIESPEIVVSGGFTIDNNAERVLVGMPFTSKLETMPIVIDPQDKAANKKIMSVWFDLYKTGYMEYGNGPDSTLVNMNFNNNLDLDNTATAQDLVTSRVKLKRGSWGYGSMMKQTIFVQSDQPMPLIVRSITPAFKMFGN